MRRYLAPLLGLGCLLALVLACYGGALRSDRQFGYRDAAHYYYPLYQRVEEEWNAHRLPLWEPEENAGMPLLGNPTAAVLYPGKIIYRLVPYAWGARLYIVFHTVLAFAGTVLLLRSWGTSWSGTTLGALAYAFGAPILFQYCNVIYLVGAAWLPFGFRAVDRWLRLGRRIAIVELALVLAMQALGGDPQLGYLTGVCAGGYALGLARWQGRPEGARSRPWKPALALIALIATWIVASIAVAAWVPSLRGTTYPPPPLPWMSYVPAIVLAVWGTIAIALLYRWHRRGRRTALVPMLGGLIAAAALAGGVAAVQLLPVFEFTGQSSRAAASGPHDIYPFSLEPVRVVEFFWPNLFGTPFEGNRSWIAVVPPVERRAKVWVPSLYLGGLTIILAVSSFGFRNGPPWRAWLAGVALLSLLASFGEYSSPVWWARWDPAVQSQIGAHDKLEEGAIRFDKNLRDGDGGIYWCLATALPGFRQFRFPGKLVTLTALAIACLAAIGWDRMLAGRTKSVSWIASTLLASSLIALVAVTVFHTDIVQAMNASPGAKLGSAFGPFDANGAFAELRRSLLQGSIVFAAALLLATLGARRPALAGALAALALSTDLALANARYIQTVPQALFERESKVLKLIKEAERKNPSPSPYRVHRMPIWNPLLWQRENSPDRIQHFVEWEHDTLQPKYGISSGVEYTWTLGVSELYDYDFFFGPWTPTVDGAVAKKLNVQPGEKVVYFPRRSFDLWNTRYFIIPGFPNGWIDEHRGYASFLADSRPLYPTADMTTGPDADRRREDWLLREDFQLLRNLKAYPRAWAVHEGRFMKTIHGLDRLSRAGPMEDILYQNDELWHDPTRIVVDPTRVAWLDEDNRVELANFLPKTARNDREIVTVSHYDPLRVELDVSLETPGLVVLADVYYPGWRLRIDDQDAPIYRANRMMRGAAVPSGKHHLVYTYEPRSFRVGASITIGALLVAAVAAVVFILRPAARNALSDPV